MWAFSPPNGPRWLQPRDHRYGGILCPMSMDSHPPTQLPTPVCRPVQQRTPEWCRVPSCAPPPPPLWCLVPCVYSAVSCRVAVSSRLRGPPACVPGLWRLPHLRLSADVDGAGAVVHAGLHHLLAEEAVLQHHRGDVSPAAGWEGKR